MLKWIAGGTAAFFAGRFLLKLNRASKSILTRTRIRVSKIGLSGLELKANVLLQNPNPINLSIQFPFVNLTHQGSSIGSSTIKNEKLQIEENTEKSFELSIRSTGWLSLIQILGAGLVQKMRSGEKVTIDLLATTTTQVNGIPYEQQEQIKLNI